MSSNAMGNLNDGRLDLNLPPTLVESSRGERASLLVSIHRLRKIIVTKMCVSEQVDNWSPLQHPDDEEGYHGGGVVEQGL